MTNLEITTDNFDTTKSFEILVPARRNSDTLAAIKVTLRQDYETAGDGIFWAMNSGSSIRSEYSDADRAERKRLAEQGQVVDGDIVTIDGAEYTTRVLGNFSNCAIFDKI